MDSCKFRIFTLGFRVWGAGLVFAGRSGKPPVFNSCAHVGAECSEGLATVIRSGPSGSAGPLSLYVGNAEP